VAYNWAGSADDNWDVYVKGVGQGALPLRLTNNPAADWAPAWSPDGRQIAFVREIDESGAIYTVPSSGGQEHKLIDLEGPVWQADQVTFISALTWSPDGGSLAYAEKRSETEPARIVRVSLATLERLPVTSPPEGAFGDLSPEFSPDGRQLAFSRQASRSWGTQDLWIQPAQGGRGRQLTHDGYGWCSNLSWTPDQRNIVFSTSHAFTGGNIFRVALSGGAPEPLAGVGSNVAFPSVRGGRMAHVLHTSSARQLWRIPGRRAAAALRRPERLSTSNWWDGSPAYSPDGRRIAFESDRGGVQNIWTSRGDGADPAQVTAFERPAGTPRWSPDGRRIVFDSSKAGGWDIYVAEVEGGIPRRLTDDPASDNVATFSRDGRGIYFSSDRTGQRQVWRMPVEGGSAVQVTRGGGLYAEESWDGRYVYHTKDAGGGRTAVWRVPVAGGDEVEVLPGLNSWADWTLARGGIYYLRSREVLRGRRSENEIRYLDFATGQTRSLFRKDGAFDLYGLAVSPDEESILFGEHPLPQSELLLVENFR
jgi:Tol biopolymer transport system component